MLTAAVPAALLNNDIYSDARVRAISGRSSVTVGDTFLAELDTDEALRFSQFNGAFQTTWPAVTLRRILKLSFGWRMTAQAFNGAAAMHRGNRALAAVITEPEDRAIA